VFAVSAATVVFAISAASMFPTVYVAANEIGATGGDTSSRAQPTLCALCNCV
jgi:hypothetical protein